jgi:polysaccharide export outer membrane protein
MRRTVMLLLSSLILCITSCSYNPNFEADVSGLGDLAGQRPPVPATPDAASLPKLDDPGARPAYRIGPLDQITVIVWGRPDLGSQVPADREGQRKITTVAADGTVALPFIDRLAVAGLTAAEASQLIQDTYARSVTTPQVETEVVAFRSQSVMVEGEVERPGMVYIADNIMTVGEALASAGGTTGEADTRNGVLIRDGGAYHVDGWNSRRGANEALNVLLERGDKIYFPSNNERVFYVLGDVLRQGAYPIPDRGITLLEGLAAAGGPNLDSAKLQPITLIRMNGDESTVYEFRLGQAVASGDVALFPGDRLYVSRTRLWYWGNVWRQMVPFISLASAAWFIDRLFSE